MLFDVTGLKFVPAITTVDPTSPFVGEKEVIVGTCPNKKLLTKQNIERKKQVSMCLFCIELYNNKNKLIPNFLIWISINT